MTKYDPYTPGESRQYLRIEKTRASINRHPDGYLVGWHTLPVGSDGKPYLARDDGRFVRKNRWLVRHDINHRPVPPPPLFPVKTCSPAMHACFWPGFLHRYEAGPMVCRVCLRGPFDIDSDKVAGTARIVNAMFNVTEEALLFAAKTLPIRTRSESGTRAADTRAAHKALLKYLASDRGPDAEADYDKAVSRLFLLDFTIAQIKQRPLSFLYCAAPSGKDGMDDFRIVDACVRSAYRRLMRKLKRQAK